MRSAQRIELRLSLEAKRKTICILTDAVEKVFLNHGAQILRAVGASIRNSWGSHHHMVNLPMTSVEWRLPLVLPFSEKNSSSVLRDFFDSIDPTETSAWS